jgi:hypothetical protein
MKRLCGVVLISIGSVLVVPGAASAGPLLSNSQASPGSASGSFAEVPGVIAINKSETTKTSSKATVLNVGGQDLLAYENGQYTGLLAPAGTLVRQVNDSTCPGAGNDPNGSCFVVLWANTTDSSNNHNASAVLLAWNGPGNGINIGGSNSATQVSGSSDCTDVSNGYVIVSKKQYDNGTGMNALTFTRAASLGQPC